MYNLIISCSLSHIIVPKYCCVGASLLPYCSIFIFCVMCYQRNECYFRFVRKFYLFYRLRIVIVPEILAMRTSGAFFLRMTTGIPENFVPNMVGHYLSFGKLLKFHAQTIISLDFVLNSGNHNKILNQ